MSKLTRQYLFTHMTQQSAAPASPEEAQKAQSFADQFVDEILAAGQNEFESDSDERDELTMSLPVTIRPVVNAPMGGCIEVCVGIGIAQICYHRDFQGDRPGTG